MLYLAAQEIRTMEIMLRERALEGDADHFLKIARRRMVKVRLDRKFSRDKVGRPKNHHVYRRSC